MGPGEFLALGVPSAGQGTKESKTGLPTPGIDVQTGQAWDNRMWTDCQPVRLARVTPEEPGMDTGLYVGWLKEMVPQIWELVPCPHKLFLCAWHRQSNVFTWTRTSAATVMT